MTAAVSVPGKITPGAVNPGTQTRGRNAITRTNSPGRAGGRPQVPAGRPSSGRDAVHTTASSLCFSSLHSLSGSAAKNLPAKQET